MLPDKIANASDDALAREAPDRAQLSVCGLVSVVARQTDRWHDRIQWFYSWEIRA